MHLIIPYAASETLGPAAWSGLPLPRLQALLQGLQLTRVLDKHEAQPPHMPHERLLAQALGWADDGPWPWAAWHSVLQGHSHPTPQAWLTPCHWQVGMDQVVLIDPTALQLTDAESQALMAAVQPLLQEDGLQLHWQDALHWHARGDALQAFATASLDRVIGQNLRHWLPQGPTARTLSRLQSEVQMLLYHHPVNEARESRRQLTVNAFWLHGAGRLPDATGPAATQTGSAWPDMPMALRESARRGDVTTWQAAWQTLDQTAVADLLAHWQRTGQATLSLCSEDRAHTFEARPMPWHQRLKRRLQPLGVADTLQALITP